MAFTNYEDFLAAKKKMDTYEIRVADNSLTVDQAYDVLIATDVRKERDAKLAASDWTQMADSPLAADKKTEWAAYRTSLRDLPSATGFPHTHTWPTEPST